MAVNTRFATGVHALALLASEPDVLQTSDDVAGKLNTNPVVIRRVFSLLHQAGLVESQKGPHGGSRLARPAKSITLAEIYSALDGGELFHSATFGGAETAKTRAKLKSAFTDAERALRDELSKTSLSDLVKKGGKKGKKR
ncbi:MAG TPA: Rrf2 family transcriptional regulator [Acidobacteriaceae bacterium]|jgi:Rrf2 family protein|nr:Rrf2 family transcriptional regulator [Acidobacteriaceae bacterium]